jgi:hypothetical protein
MTFGRPVAAFPDQDHLAHLQVLLDYMTSPYLGQLAVIAPTFTPAALDHVKEHVALWYVNNVYETVSEATGQDLGDLMKFRDPATRKELDQTLAAASHEAVAQAKQKFASLPAVVQRAQQMLESMSPGVPPDPKAQTDMAKAKIGQQTAREKIQADQQKVQMTLAADAQRDAQKAQSDTQRDALKAQADSQRQDKMQQQLTLRQASQDQSEMQRTQVEQSSRERMNTADNVTALTIAEAETLSDHKAAVETGTGINPTP